MKDWFVTEKIGEGLYRISEPRHYEETNCYLVEGRERALLIDSGLGVGDITSPVRKLTDKSIAVVATHVHWDHIGAHGAFEEFYVHEAEREWIEERFPLEAEEVLAQLKRGELPEDFSPGDYTLFKGKASRILSDGDEIDLGGIVLRVIHTPGHSHGHICLWEEERGWLFTGDTVYKGTIYADFPSTDPKALLKSMERIAKLKPKRIFPAHHDTSIEVDIIQEMLEGLREIEGRDMLRHGGGSFDFGDWGIRL